MGWDGYIHVVVGVILNQNNQVLISLRPNHSHLGGCWEFPGGKVEQNETIEQALFRELKEELDIEIEECRPLIKVTHHYDEKSVLLDVWAILSYTGAAKGNEGQRLCWKPVTQLDANDFPKADIPVIKAIQLPERCLITGKFDSEDDFTQRLKAAIDNHIKLIQLRITDDCLLQHGITTAKRIIRQAEIICESRHVTLTLNCADGVVPDKRHNLHLNSRKLMDLSVRPRCDLLSASCHNPDELLKAEELEVDFVFLSPVKYTQSHPDALPLDWSQFSYLLREINIPTYALGGLSDNDLSVAWSAGAQGIASISAFW